MSNNKKNRKRLCIPIKSEMQLLGIIIFILVVIVYGILEYLNGSKLPLVVASIFSLTILIFIKNESKSSSISMGGPPPAWYGVGCVVLMLILLTYLSIIQFKTGEYLFGIISALGVFVFLICSVVIAKLIFIDPKKQGDGERKNNMNGNNS